MVPRAGVSPQSSNTLMSFPRVFPGKAVDLRMKNYEQLWYLQQLYEDGILDQKEYMEQKQDILKLLKSYKFSVLHITDLHVLLLAAFSIVTPEDCNGWVDHCGIYYIPSSNLPSCGY